MQSVCKLIWRKKSREKNAIITNKLIPRKFCKIIMSVIILHEDPNSFGKWWIDSLGFGYCNRQSWRKDYYLKRAFLLKIGQQQVKAQKKQGNWGLPCSSCRAAFLWNTILTLPLVKLNWIFVCSSTYIVVVRRFSLRNANLIFY